MKSYTDLEQSKKLAEFLPIESADHFHIIGHLHTDGPRYEVIRPKNEVSDHDSYWPCWSLAALMNFLDDKAGLAKEYGLWFCYDNGKSHCTKHYETQIDAAFEMVVWLKENGKL